jgi:predicted MFS family arabinose efflux permease
MSAPESAASVGPGTTAVGHSPRRLIAAAVLATTSGSMPVFLMGGLAVQAASDTGLDVARLGILASVYFGSSAIWSTPAGPIAERLGTHRSILVSSTLSVIALTGIGALGSSIASLAVFMFIAGMSNGVAQPAANLMLARSIPRDRQGFAFGIKQAAVPLGSLIAGASVPTVGLTIGWRWAFIISVVTPIVTVLLTPRIDEGPRRRQRGPTPDASLRALVAIAAAAGCGTASATTLGTFVVSSSVDNGMDPARAGVLLAVGSLLGVSARIIVGIRADRREGGHLREVMVLMAVGAFGFLLLAAGGGDALLFAGTALGFAAGWGWNGLLVYAVVLENPSAPASATGITQTGLYLGGMSGPALFGLLSARYGFSAGWLLGAALLSIALALTALGSRWFADGDGPRSGVRPAT